MLMCLFLVGVRVFQVKTSMYLMVSTGRTLSCMRVSCVDLLRVFGGYWVLSLSVMY